MDLIDSMPAGPEMDMLVEKCILGHEIVESKDGKSFMVKMSPNLTGPIPKYSTNDADIDELFDHVGDGGINRKGSVWEAQVHPAKIGKAGVVRAIGETRALAGCRALLKAVGAKK